MCQRPLRLKYQVQLPAAAPWTSRASASRGAGELDDLVTVADLLAMMTPEEVKDDEFIPLTSDIRTSWTTWCDNATCYEDPIVSRVWNRIVDVTQVPRENFEYMQLLRYLPCAHAGDPDCQFYRRHHDTIPELAVGAPKTDYIQEFGAMRSDVGAVYGG